MGNALIVFMGAGLGGMLRYGLSAGLMKLFGTTYPVGTFTVNLLGAFLLGALVEWWAFHSPAGPYDRLFLITGVLGGFTTFSAFSFEIMLFLQRQQPEYAVSYAFLSVLGSLAALLAGLGLVRHLAG